VAGSAGYGGAGPAARPGTPVLAGTGYFRPVTRIVQEQLASTTR